MGLDMEIKEKREFIGLTQKQIAEKLQCSERAIVLIEQGKFSESLTERYKEFINCEMFEKNTAKMRTETDSNTSVSSIEFVKSKITDRFTYKVELSLSVAELKYIDSENRFCVTHKPVKSTTEILAKETKEAMKICRVFNEIINSK